MKKIRIEKLSDKDINERGISGWPIWTKEKSSFDWHYDDTEECFILEGEVTVKTADGDIHFSEGDFVTFEKGLSCHWIIHRDVRKHFNFL